jgi:uncharacterized BrkB/YihY/UPF0761 family membrane protein
MKKRDLIIVGVFLIIAAVMLELLIHDSTPRNTDDLVDFFSGMLIAAGIFVLSKQIFTKK